MIGQVRTLVPPTRAQPTPENVLSRNQGAISDFLGRVEAAVRESILRGKSERGVIEFRVGPSGLEIAWVSVGPAVKYS